MAQVLAVVPQAGLEAVLVAIELVLEGRTPSGSIIDPASMKLNQAA